MLWEREGLHWASRDVGVPWPGKSLSYLMLCWGRPWKGVWQVGLRLGFLGVPGLDLSPQDPSLHPLISSMAPASA